MAKFNLFCGIVAILCCLVKTEEEPASKERSFIPSIFQAPTCDVSSAYFVEWFDDPNSIGKKWVKSIASEDGLKEPKYKGKWGITHPLNIVLENDLALVVKDASAHHAIAATLKKPFKFDEKLLVVQYEVKYQDGQVCGGGYVKLLSSEVNEKLENFHDKTPYTIMFGPDKCGATSKIHLIIRHKNPINGTISEHHAKASNKPTMQYFDKEYTHLYTLIIKSDNSYKILIDNFEFLSGNLLTDLQPPVTPPKQIYDPETKKPLEWDDREFIVDPNATKPEDWDESQPKEIEDMDAKIPSDWSDEEELIFDKNAIKPADWDSEIDGEWEPNRIKNPTCASVSGCGKWKRPKIANPLYKGKWVPPTIPNPNFTKIWTPPLIDNPNYFEADPYRQLAAINAFGIELWTISNEILFDNIIITDDLEMAQKFAEQTFDVKLAQERLYNQVFYPPKTFLEPFWALTEDYPWLLPGLIVLFVILLVAICVFCFGKRSREAPNIKKTDAFQADDEEMNQEMEEGEEPEEIVPPSTSGVEPEEPEEDEKIVDISSNPVKVTLPVNPMASNSSQPSTPEQSGPSRRTRIRRQE